MVADPAPARDLLRDLPLRAGLAWTRPVFPEPGEALTSWRARRTPVRPSARLGVPLELDAARVGVDGDGTARVLLTGALEAADVSEQGLLLDRIRASARGEAGIERSTSRLRCLRLPLPPLWEHQARGTRSAS